MISERERIRAAIELAVRHGQLPGEDHRLWVIDRLIHCLAGDEAAYEAILADACRDGREWDRGIAP